MLTTNRKLRYLTKTHHLITLSHFQGREGRTKKRRSRWGSEDAKVNIPGLPTVLPSGLAPEQLDAFVIHMRLEEINRKLRDGIYVPSEKERYVISSDAASNAILTPSPISDLLLPNLCMVRTESVSILVNIGTGRSWKTSVTGWWKRDFAKSQALSRHWITKGLPKSRTRSTFPSRITPRSISLDNSLVR